MVREGTKFVILARVAIFVMKWHVFIFQFQTPPTAMASFTFSCWVHPANALDLVSQFFVYNRALEWDPSIKIGLLADGRVEAYLASTQFTSDAGAVPADEWSHIAITMQSYANGNIF